jgi:hypothetical protein
MNYRGTLRCNYSTLAMMGDGVIDRCFGTLVLQAPASGVLQNMSFFNLNLDQKDFLIIPG